MLGLDLWVLFLVLVPWSDLLVLFWVGAVLVAVKGGAGCHGWIFGCCLGRVLFWQQVWNHSWQQKRMNYKYIWWLQIWDTKQSYCWFSLFWWWHERFGDGSANIQRINEKKLTDICLLLQTTIATKSGRYHKMFELNLTMICDNATLCTRFPLLGRELKIPSAQTCAKVLNFLERRTLTRSLNMKLRFLEINAI